jgi:hypothetical protein
MGSWDEYAIQQAGNILQVGMQNQSNKRAFKRSADFTREMFDKTNEYNHPVQQMARLKEAGLNPALMYGKSGGTGVATQPAGQKQDATQIPDLNAGLGYAELQLIKSNIKNNKSQSDLNNLKGATEAQNAALVKEQTAKTKAEAQSAKATADLASELTDAQLQAQLIDIKGKEAGIKQTEAQTENIKQSTVESKNRIQVANSQLAMNLKLNNAQVESIQKNMEKVQKELDKLGVEKKYMQKLVYLTEAKAATEYIETEIKRLERDGYGTNHILTGAIGQLMRTIISL